MGEMRERTPQEVEAAEAAHRVLRAEMEAENARLRAEGHVFEGCFPAEAEGPEMTRKEAKRRAAEWFAKVSAGKAFVGDGVTHVSNSEAARRDAEAAERWGS